jgi:monoamine oxidase
MNSIASKTIIDVAIAGGGISGIYSGWRLLSDARAQGAAPRHVVLFESSRRIGGRLLSLKPPGINDTMVEIGGMRFQASHRWVNWLIETLELKTGPLPSGQLENMAYLRGKRLRCRDLSDWTKLPYAIAPDERDPQALDNLTALAAVRALGPAFQKVLGIELSMQNIGTITEAQWRQVGEEGDFEGTPLHEIPIHYLLLRTLSREATRLAEEGSGYNSILYTWNAADGFPWNLADFAGDIPHFKVLDGFNSIPVMIAQRYRQLGGRIDFEAKLRNFEAATLPDGTAGVRFTVAYEEHETSYLARNLILAMPRRSLELLDQTGPLLAREHSWFRKLLESVTPIPLLKIGLCYETCWWESVVGTGASGKSITDLPIRQVYYWHKDPKSQRGVVMIYDDGLDLQYWDQLDDGYSRAERYIDRALSEGEMPEWSAYSVPQKMVDEAHRQLLEIHGCKAEDVPAPYAASFMNWASDPYGGGAHFWNVGAKSREVSARMIKPREDLPVYICGEAWSQQLQGWAEGALITAETMLQDHFGLSDPLSTASTQG